MKTVLAYGTDCLSTSPSQFPCCPHTLAPDGTRLYEELGGGGPSGLEKGCSDPKETLGFRLGPRSWNVIDAAQCPKDLSKGSWCGWGLGLWLCLGAPGGLRQRKEWACPRRVPIGEGQATPCGMCQARGLPPAGPAVGPAGWEGGLRCQRRGGAWAADLWGSQDTHQQRVPG